MAFRIGYKEIAAIAVLALLIIAAIIAVMIKDVDELVDPEISIEVQSSYTTDQPIDDLSPIQGKIWQIVEVNITNQNEEMEFLVSVPHFYGYTEEKEKIWVFNGEDFQYDPIEPGQNVTVRLVFLISEGTSLLELEYTQKLSSSVKCSIPQ